MKLFNLLRKNIVQAALLACVFLGAAGAAAYASDTGSQRYALTLNDSAVGVFPRGVSYEGISLEGKTLEAARTEINEYITSRLKRYMTWNVLGYTYEYDGGSFITTCTNMDIIDQLDDLTMSGNLVEQYKKQKDLDANPVNLDFVFTIDDSLILDQVQAYVNMFSTSPSNATIRRVNGQFAVTEAVNGISFDTEAIYNDLVALISDFSTSEPIAYTFPYTETPPAYNSSYFNFSAVPLGSYTTTELGSANRTQNIALAAQNMNGHVYYPGEKVSALNMYGEVTAEAGYVMAPGYSQGKQVDTIGGGICQLTTTLYNAVLRAELTVSYRKNHSMLVTYVPPGMDAMVSPADNSDFTFINSSNYPIYIESYVSGDSVVVNIWGVEERPANRRVDFATQVLSISWPEKLYNIINNDEICQVGGVRVDYKHDVDIQVHPNLQCISYKLVYIDGVLAEQTVLNEDKYAGMTGTIYKASDCNITASVREGNPGESMVFKYIGWTVDLSITTLSGEEWPYYDY